MDEASAQSAMMYVATDLEITLDQFEVTILDELTAQEALTVLSIPNHNGEIQLKDDNRPVIRRENGEVECENCEDVQSVVQMAQPRVPVMVLPLVPVVSE